MDYLSLVPKKIHSTKPVITINLPVTVQSNKSICQVQLVFKLSNVMR